MKTIPEYVTKFRKDYPFRYAIAFGELEGALRCGSDLTEQMCRLKAAMDEVESGGAEALRKQADA